MGKELFVENEKVKQKRLIALWLFTVSVMIFIMVLIGGFTRLTHSGLSMVSWKPFTGWIPPLIHHEWIESFSAYKLSPEYLKLNFGMTLSEFKSIYWLEFIHRVWGRIIGIIYFIPFIVFYFLGWLKGRLLIHLVFLLILGAGQGGLGWFMVKSGLIDSPDVSQYRLAAHLCLAIFILGYLVWLGLLVHNYQFISDKYQISFAFLIPLFLIFLTIFSGALVAGLDAGLVYNTFPLMDGKIIPHGILDLVPLYLNFFENVITVQFDHRILALVTLGVSFLFWLKQKKCCLSKRQSLSLDIFLFFVFFQVSLGIITLLLVVPIWLGVLHQATAALLFVSTIWMGFELCFCLKKDRKKTNPIKAVLNK